MKSLIGIKEETMEKLRQNELHTFELIASDNVETARKLEEGEDIFITQEGKKDVSMESKGIVAEVKSSKKFYQKIDTLFDEEETLAVRLQAEYVGEGEIKDVILEDKGVEVEIEKDLWMG